MNPALRDILESTSFSPANLSGLGLWLDASDAASITLDGSNTVSQWSDKSGNARHATALVNQRPTYLSSGINGLPALRGDGVDDFMEWTPFASGTNHNFYLVVAFDAGVNQYPQFSGFFGAGSAEVSWNGMQIDTTANPAYAARAGSAGGNAEHNILAANTVNNIRSGNPFVFSFLRNGATWRTKQTYGTVSSFTLTAPYDTGTTRSKYIFRNYFTSTSFRIAELVCYTRDLSAGEEAQLSAYFSARYGVGI